MVFHFDLWAAIAYALVSLWLIFRAGQFQWFWASIVLWLAVGFWGAKLLPGMWGITHVGPLFIPHFYLTAGSVFFFIDYWKKTPDKGLWEADSRYPLLSLFAVSNAVMTLAFATVALAVWYQYPQGLSVAAVPALLKIYALNPVYWFALQLVLMAVFYLHRTVVMKQPASLFSGRQLQGGYLMVLAALTVILVFVMAEGRF